MAMFNSYVSLPEGMLSYQKGYGVSPCIFWILIDGSSRNGTHRCWNISENIHHAEIGHGY